MNTITTLDLTSMKQLRLELDQLLSDWGKKNNLVITTGKGKYALTSATFEVKLATKENDGTVVTEEVRNFRRSAHLYNLTPEDLGRLFTSNGLHFHLSGLMPSRPKFPFLAKCVEDGKTYKFTEKAIEMHLVRATAAGLR